ncbi:dopamine receptor 1 [Patella vulgata]|uniref:dopamine receptor 1 n=1 Tax=Patella vulgata TaxID=6465 RepID=UPI002180128C|nr:dopamine receptor 1 [Patella vulgata]
MPSGYRAFVMSVNWTLPTYNIESHGNSDSPQQPPNITNTGAASTEVYNLPEKVVIGTVLACIIFISISGNILVCVAVFTDRKLKRNSNLFIVSLAIADLLVAVLVMTFALANDIQGTWEFGAVFCKVWISADIMCSTASILNLCAISLDRFIHIKDPLRYESYMTGRRTMCFISVVWCLSLLISFVPIHLGWHQDPGDGVGPNSNEDMCIFELNPIYAIVSSAISFYIPCIVMLSIYCRLYLYARKHVESMKRTTTTADRFNGGSDKKVSSKVSDHKAAVTLGIIMGVFLFCWLPFFTVNLIAAFCATCIAPVVFKILTWLGYVNSSLNPIIYSIFNQEFREAFRKILFPKCVLEDHTSASYSLRPPVKKINKAEYAPPLVENGANHRRSSRERLFTEKITSL